MQLRLQICVCAYCTLIKEQTPFSAHILMKAYKVILRFGLILKLREMHDLL